MPEEAVGRAVRIHIETGRGGLRPFIGQTIEGKVVAISAGSAPLHRPRAFIQAEPGEDPRLSGGLLTVEYAGDRPPGQANDELAVRVHIALWPAGAHRRAGRGTGRVSYVD